jgi:hypothetical protein
MILSTLGRLAFILSVPAIVVACVVDTTNPPTEVSSGGGGGGGSGSAVDGGAASTGAPSEHPILVPIDTNTSGAPQMTAAPGQGVGVFSEYDGAGSWHVWWTCDSLVDSTNPPCPFDVKIDVQTGTITQPVTQGFQTADTFTSSGTQLEAVTTTSTGTDGVTFQTAPGAAITLSATVGGQYDGRFIFFVEGGKLDDGFTGTVTDPIILQGATP